MSIPATVDLCQLHPLESIWQPTCICQVAVLETRQQDFIWVRERTAGSKEAVAVGERQHNQQQGQQRDDVHSPVQPSRPTQTEPPMESRTWRMLLSEIMLKNKTT